MISFENMELTRSKNERCVYASSEGPLFMDNHYNSIYDTCKFRHSCALWKAMTIYHKHVLNNISSKNVARESVIPFVVSLNQKKWYKLFDNKKLNKKHKK